MADILRRTEFKNNEKKRITIVPCCADLEKFNIGLNIDKTLLRKYNLENKFIFIYLGSLGTCYKFDEMLNFFRVANQYIENAHFLILTQIDRQIAEYSIRKSNLNFRNFTILSVEPKDVPKYIRLSDVALIFIKQTFSKLASSPTKVVECLACGIPVIVNYKMGDIVDKNKIGIVIEKYLESEYKIKIQKYLDLIQDNNSLKQKCFQVAKDNFSLKIGIEKYLKVYNQIM